MSDAGVEHADTDKLAAMRVARTGCRIVVLPVQPETTIVWQTRAPPQYMPRTRRGRRRGVDRPEQMVHARARTGTSDRRHRLRGSLHRGTGRATSSTRPRELAEEPREARGRRSGSDFSCRLAGWIQTIGIPPAPARSGIAVDSSCDGARIREFATPRESRPIEFDRLLWNLKAAKVA